MIQNSLSDTMEKTGGAKSKNKKLERIPTKVIKDNKDKNSDKKSTDIVKTDQTDINNLSTDEIFRLADLHFNKKNYIFRHLYDSYNKFIEEDIKTFLENGEHVFTEVITNTTYFKYRFKFENVMIDGPTMNNGIEPMFPSDARHNNYTYSVKLMADVTQYQDIIDIASDQKIVRQNGEMEKMKHIATIPLMVRSKWCSLYTNKNLDRNECDYDAGGYFIVNGNEKVIICQDRMVENKPLVFVKKDSGAMSYIVQCNSKSYKPHGMTQVISVKMKKDEIMMLRVPILNEVNVCAVFRALGLESDRKIIDFIAYDEHDTDMIDVIRASLDSCQTDKGVKISSQEEAIEYLIPKLRVLKKYTETDAETKKLQKQMHLKNLLLNNFLPHVEGPLINKAYYLGYMLNRLLRVYLKKQPLDDRDSYINKRIDLPGDLMFELFKQQYKKLLGECKKFFDGRNKSVENPVVVIPNIKPNLIEQGFKASLSTGHWIRRQGVAQMLQRLTYLQTISFLRRVDAPGGDASSEKLTHPRHAHPSSIPFLCVTETPEHAKVGLTKHLSMIATVTIMSRDQYYLLKEFITRKVKNITDVPYHKFRDYNMFKVFLNGDWVGMTDKPQELYQEMQKLKSEGVFDQKNVSIVTDNDECELRIYCDSGRLVRPLITVKDNELLLKKHHIKQISLNKIDRMSKVTDWDEFLLKNPGVIEYVDAEAQQFLMIATKGRVIEEQRKKMINSVNLVKNIKSRHVNNRYDELFYEKYTHCEIHPSLLMGEITTNVPFCDRNQGPRNIFCYAQSRQAMGIFATNYRDRLDISFILYYPQRPLVTTRTSRYTNSEHLPSGENCIVAIACYTGYNQEDSLIFNRSSIERGKFRAIYLKKYLLQIQKNQSTSQDDIFGKPDPSKLINIKYGSYDKLNDKGYAPEETRVENGDAVLGKMTPVEDPNNTGKCFKDSSETYKMFAPGVIDRAYIDIQNQDGYMTRKLSIRSERIPRIGDKYSCYTDDHEVLTTDGWVNIKDVKKTHKVACMIDGTLEYHNPTEIQKYDFDGDLYKIESNQVNLLVTPTHRMYVGNRDGEKFSIKTAAECYGKRWTYKKNVDDYKFTGKKSGFIDHNKRKFLLPETDDLDELPIDLESWLTFFGIWIAEGCTLRDYGVSFATHKERVKDALSLVSQKMNFKIQKHKDQKDDEDKNAWVYADKRLVEYIKPLSVGAVNKSLPEWVWELSKEDCRTLIKGMMLGDGHTMENGTRRYDTSSKQLADDFQRLCLHAGYSTNIILKYEAGHVAVGKEKTITSTADAYRMTIIETQNTPLVNKNIKTDGSGRHDSWVKFKGNVYCCTVPGEGIIYVRKDKMPVWSCNSRHGQKGTIGILLDGVDMPFNKYGVRPDIILNPNAIPSRMTIGQLVECLMGKTAALQGMDADGTPFEEHDIEAVKDKLESLGYERNGKEYLYNGMTGEKMKVEIFIGPTFYQRLKHLVEDKLHCLSPDHEVLTETGWKFIDKITLDDKVACLNNGELDYKHPTQLHQYPNYKGKMYHIKTQQIDLQVTPNHRMWTSKVHGRKKTWLDHDFELAENIIGKHRKYKKDAKWTVADYQFELPEVNCENGVTYPAMKPKMDSWLKFFGLWIAEGWTTTYSDKRYPNSPAYRVQICQCKPRVRKVLEKTMDDLGYNYTQTDEKFTISNKQLYKYMSTFSVGAPEKSLPDWTWKLSQKQCRILLEHMIMGDGSYDKSGSTRYYTSSIKLADEVMRLALHCGWSANKYLHCNAGNEVEIYGRKVVSNHDMWRLGIIKKKNTPEVNHSHKNTQEGQLEEIVNDYSGGVYCLSVPSQVFYVRRNGLPVWTANSRARGPKTSLTRQAPEGRSRDGGLRLGEMERDALIAHGASKFLKEKLLDNSDPYTTYVCGICGLFAQRFNRREDKHYSQDSDIYCCVGCNNYTDIHKVKIPYAFKLFCQELLSMSLAPRIRFHKDIYNS